jgi:hypothetical protein
MFKYFPPILSIRVDSHILNYLLKTIILNLILDNKSFHCNPLMDPKFIQILRLFKHT